MSDATRGVFAFFGEWQAGRARRARAAAYVATLGAEPSEADVRWLTEHGTDGDLDHARWELRYARRALGLVTAQRDALDDRTASIVARELAIALARDPNVATGKLRVAEQQLNARLRGYGDAMSKRQGAGTGWHLGRALLRFAGRLDAPAPESVAYAADLMAGYLEDANSALREHFGETALPDNIAPSAVR